MRLTLLFALILGTVIASPSIAHDTPRNTLVPPGQHPYRPSAMPDRVILTITEEPATSQIVNWRTVPGVDVTEAQIAVATGSVGLHLDAARVIGSHRTLLSENGLALHHEVRFDGLEPNTLYAYRVRGLGTWSEWFQFRTAKADAEGFSFLYFGDAQNSVKSHFSRVIREARQELPRPAFMLHAGDLVNLRAGNHDDEWGEWFDAGAFLYAMTPNVVVSGNHEHITEERGDGTRVRILSEHFRAQFGVPTNGLPELADTVWATRYQDVLIVVLDSTQALEDPSIAARQAAWLDALLTADDSRWVIISHHHPMYSVSLGRDNPVLREHWKPVYDRHAVDLVLQGHDHTYGRGDNVAEGTMLVDDEVGTVYVVSVAGPKMYLVAEDRHIHDRVGEDLQLFQIIHVDPDTLRFEARTVTGDLYDAFELIKQPGARNRLMEGLDEPRPEAVCSNPDPIRETRCWDGTELLHWTPLEAASDPVRTFATQGHFTTKTPYQPPVRIDVEAAPEDFRPLMVQHIARHGSRPLSSPGDDDLSYQVWRQARSEGALTPLGERLGPVLEDMLAVHARIGYGTISRRGEREHEDMAGRLLARQGPLFDHALAQGRRISVFHSGRQRAEFSAAAFVRGLEHARPELSAIIAAPQAAAETVYFHDAADTPAARAYRDYRGRDARLRSTLERLLALRGTKQMARRMLEALYHPDFVDRLEAGEYRFATAADSDDIIRDEVDVAALLYGLYAIAANLDLDVDFDFGRFMDPAAVAWFAYLDDAETFYERGPGFADEDVTWRAAEILVEDMLSGIEATAAGTGNEIAVFRFSHAQALIPLAAFLRIEGAYEALPETQLYSHEVSTWRSERVSPMAANVQWDAYVNDQGTIIVRMLDNERQVPFARACAPWRETRYFVELEELRRCYGLAF